MLILIMNSIQKMETSMRKSWFDHVRKVRAKMSKQKKTQVTHRDAMRSASETWPEAKQKIERAKAREARKKAKAAKVT